jgi:hypothetical protein
VPAPPRQPELDGRCTVVRAKQPPTPARLERIRHKKLGAVRERAREAAAIVVRLPDPGACRDLLSRFGLTVATEAEGGKDATELVAGIADQYAVWFGKDGPYYIHDEHYQPSRTEVLEIAGEELQRARDAP